MALKAFDIAQTFEFSLPDDSEPKTVFIVGALDSKLSAKLFDDNVRTRVGGGGQDGSADVITMVRNRQRDIVRYGIKGWRNLMDPKDPDKEITPTFTTVVLPIGPRQALSDASVDHLLPWIYELSKAVEDFNVMGSAETKN